MVPQWDALGSKVDTLSQTNLLEELEKLAVEWDVYYSSLFRSYAEEPLKSVTSDMTRRAKKARAKETEQHAREAAMV